MVQSSSVSEDAMVRMSYDAVGSKRSDTIQLYQTGMPATLSYSNRSGRSRVASARWLSRRFGEKPRVNAGFFRALNWRDMR